MSAKSEADVASAYDNAKAKLDGAALPPKAEPANYGHKIELPGALELLGEELSDVLRLRNRKKGDAGGGKVEVSAVKHLRPMAKFRIWFLRECGMERGVVSHRKVLC